MSRFAGGAKVALLFSVLSVGLALAQPRAPRPNIVFILLDDLGYSDVGFNGGDISTPQIDRLANSGAKLSALYVQATCTATRAAFLTGRYPMRYGLQLDVVRPWSRFGLPLKERTLANALQEAGYVTAIIGKWHLGHYRREYLPTMRGFQYQYGHYNGAIDYFTHDRLGGFDWHRNDKVNREEGYATTLIGNEAVDLIGRHDLRKPLFLYVAFNAPHAPLQALPEHLKRYEHVQDTTRRRYSAMVQAADEQIGRIVAALTTAGMLENTIIVFSGDNGGWLSQGATNGRFRGGKGSFYEGGVRTAAFVTWPDRIKNGIDITEPLHVVDWYPTLINLAGGSLHQEHPIDGKDIWAVLTRSAKSPHEDIVINVTPSGGALRRGDWKLIVGEALHDRNGETTSKHSSGPPAAVEIYDLASDPYEKTNLADSEQGLVRELRISLRAYAKQAAHPLATPKSPGFKAPRVWGE